MIVLSYVLFAVGVLGLITSEIVDYINKNK